MFAHKGLRPSQNRYCFALICGSLLVNPLRPLLIPLPSAGPGNVRRCCCKGDLTFNYILRALCFSLFLLRGFLLVLRLHLLRVFSFGFVPALSLALSSLFLLVFSLGFVSAGDTPYALHGTPRSLSPHFLILF